MPMPPAQKAAKLRRIAADLERAVMQVERTLPRSLARELVRCPQLSHTLVDVWAQIDSLRVMAHALEQDTPTTPWSAWNRYADRSLLEESPSLNPAIGASNA